MEKQEVEYMQSLRRWLPKSVSEETANRPFDRSRIKTVLQILAGEELRDNLHQKIPTSCPGLDQAMLGGVSVGNLVEVYGAAGSGKTQLCLQLCINVQKPSRLRGLQGESLFIDGEGRFPPERLRQMAHAVCQEWFGDNTSLQGFLDRVHFLQISNPEEARVVVCSNLHTYLTKHPSVRYSM